MENENRFQANQYEHSKAGTYVLRDQQGKMLITTTYPAVLFDRVTGTLHKHGDVNRVRRIAADMRAKYIQAGMATEARTLEVYASRNFGIDELNRCISITGYVKTMFERLTRQ